MTAYLSDGVTTIPVERFGIYRSARPGRTRVHEVLGETYPDYTLRRAGARAGVMRLSGLGESESEAVEALHASASAFTISIPSNDTANMRYVVPDVGLITRFQDSNVPDAWVVEVDFREVAP